MGVETIHGESVGATQGYNSLGIFITINFYLILTLILNSVSFNLFFRESLFLFLFFFLKRLCFSFY